MRVSSLWASGYHKVESFTCYGAPFRNMRCFKKAVSEQGDECMYTRGNQEQTTTPKTARSHVHTYSSYKALYSMFKVSYAIWVFKIENRPYKFRFEKLCFVK